MSVYFSYEVAYGCAGTYESPGELPGKLEGLDWEQLQTLELPEGFSLDVGGDMMSGPYRWALVLSRTLVRVASDQEFAVLRTFDELPSSKELVGMREVAESLKIPYDPAWHLFSNVS